MAVVVAIVATATLVAGCGDDGGSDAAVDPLPSRGATLYEASCAECHGSDLRGTDRGPSHLSIVYEPGHHPDASFRGAIEQGVRAHHWNFGDMAPVSGLDDDEIDLIIAFVRDQQAEHGFEPYPPR
jgi:mono/diheme cytochrome c family protein